MIKIIILNHFLCQLCFFVKYLNYIGHGQDVITRELRQSLFFDAWTVTLFSNKHHNVKWGVYFLYMFVSGVVWVNGIYGIYVFASNIHIKDKKIKRI